jgi:hypothetical protein
MHFGENQLSPLSIGISPLPTRHPSGLQSTPVRASTRCYARFTLHMGSSSGFGSTPRDRRPLQTCFRCGSGCNCLNRPRRVTRRIILQKARRQAGLLPGPPTAWKHTVSGSISLPSPGYFSPFPHGTVRYRSLHVTSLGKWAPQLQTGLHVSGPTQDRSDGDGAVRTRLSRSLATCSKRLTGAVIALHLGAARHPWTSYNPLAARAGTLARTAFGHSPVRSPLLRGYFLFLGVREMFQFPQFPPTIVGPHSQVRGLPHSEIVGSKAVWRLPHAYRSGTTSFIGVQRRGIHRVLIVSSFQEHLERTGGREKRPPTRNLWTKRQKYDALLPHARRHMVGERHAAARLAAVVMGIGKVQSACSSSLRTQTSFRDLHP